MKFAVLGYPTSINMGDEVQSIAAAQLLPQVDYYLDRESLHKPPTNEPIKLIANGWFMDDPKNWPPAENIDPLFISFHLTQSNGSHKKLLRGENLQYFKKHAPIGCRDLNTLKLFQQAGVEAYYSGCLTLTLQNQFKKRTNQILLVDPFRHNYTKKYRDFLEGNLVPKEFQKDVLVIRQRRTRIDTPVDQRFMEAEQLLNQYAQSKMVITSRLHAALPCLAFKTPVYFINAGYHSVLFNLNDRFEGNLNLLRQIDEHYFPMSGPGFLDRLKRNFGLFKNTHPKPLDLNWENPEPNPADFYALVKAMKERVNAFISE